MAGFKIKDTLVNTIDGAPIVLAEDVWHNGVPIPELLNGKISAVSGKGLSTNDYTTDEKNKLAGIAAGAEVNVQSDWNATSGDAFIKNKPTIPIVPTKISAFTNDSGYLTAHQSLSGYATQTWVQNQGYIKTNADGELELDGYVKMEDFLKSYSNLNASITSYSNSKTTVSFEILFGTKVLTFDEVPTVTLNGKTATVTGTSACVATFNGDARNTNNKMVVNVSGKIAGVSVTYSVTFEAYYYPVKIGFQTAANGADTSLNSYYITNLVGTKVEATIDVNGKYLYAYIPTALVPTSDKSLQLLDLEYPINMLNLTATSDTVANYKVYRFGTPQKGGSTYKLQFNII